MLVVSGGIKDDTVEMHKILRGSILIYWIWRRCFLFWESRAKCHYLIIWSHLLKTRFLSLRKRAPKTRTPQRMVNAETLNIRMWECKVMVTFRTAIINDEIS